MTKTFDGKKIIGATVLTRYPRLISELWKQFHEEALALASTTPAPRFNPNPLPLKFQFDSEQLKEYERQLEKFSRKGIDFNRTSPKSQDRGVSKRKSSKMTSSSLNKIAGDGVTIGGGVNCGNEGR